MTESVMISLDLPATNRFLNVLSACIAEMLNRVEDQPIAETQIYELQLAAQEIGANIVDHAYPDQKDGRICAELSYAPENRQLALTFNDHGVAYEERGDPSLPSVEDSVHGGMGLFLIMSLVDDVNYKRLQETNVWQITKRLS